MTDLAVWISYAIWGLGVVVALAVAVYFLHRQGRIPWLNGVLKGVRMPRLFEPKPDVLVERLKKQTEAETTKAAELRRVLEAKTELARVKAENIRLRKEIDGVSERSVEKEKRAVEKDKLDAEKAKPRRL